MILVTGATGFIGNALVLTLLNNGLNVLAGVRKKTDLLPDNVKQVVLGDLKKLPEINILHLQNELSEVEVIVHTSARVHVMHDDLNDPLSEFRKVNRDATIALARIASSAGVKRFVFLSSIKVNGETTSADKPFTPDDVFIPEDEYALSKYEAEQSLIELASETGMEVVIIRPPLVYGPKVKANFESMMKWISRGVPLPFGAIRNRRSLVALDNLVNFIVLCSCIEKSTLAANQIFLISDGEDVSTTKLLLKVAKALGKRAFLIPVPTRLMIFAASLIGKKDVAVRLFGSLYIDSSKAFKLLNWEPVVTIDEQLKKTAEAFLHEKNI